MISPDTYLQVISILIGIIAVVIPLGISFVIIVYMRKLKSKIASLSSDVDDLWDKVKELSNAPSNNNQP